MSKLIDASDIATALHLVLPTSALLSLARLQGRMICHRSHHRQDIKNNLLRYIEGLSETEADIFTRQFFEWENVRNLIASFAPRMSSDKLGKLLNLEGTHHIDDALKHGKGVLLVGSHLNSRAFYAAIMQLRKLGYDLALALPDKYNPWQKSSFCKLLESVIGEAPLILDAMGGFYCQFNIRPIIKRLQANQMVAQTGDGLHSANFVEIDFLGSKAPFTTGSWSIAQMTGAAVVPIFCVGNPQNGLRTIIHEAVYFENKNDKAELAEKIADYAATLENYIRQSPPAWQHWEMPKTLETAMASTRQKLDERYNMN